MDDAGTVVQFLSYGGTLTADDGPADGIESEAIEVTGDEGAGMRGGVAAVQPSMAADAASATAADGALGLDVYPNPSAGTATVSLTVAEASEVRVVVYDVLGRSVAVLHAGPLGAGEHALAFESAGLPAGLYLVRAEGNGFTAARRVTVVR